MQAKLTFRCLCSSFGRDGDSPGQTRKGDGPWLEPGSSLLGAPSFPSRSRSPSSVSLSRRPENRPMPTAVLTTVLAASPIVLGERGIILHSSTFVILSAVPYFPWTAALYDARYLSAAVLLPAHFIRPSSVGYRPHGLLPPRGCAPRALIRCSTHDGDFRPIIDSDIGRILLPPQSTINHQR